MSAYLTAVLADNPVHYWRFADPGGLLAHDIGSSPLHLPSGLVYGSLGWSGPVSDGGSCWVSSAQFPQSQGLVPTVNSPFSWEVWIWRTGHLGFNAFILQWDGVGTPESQAVMNNSDTVQVSVNAAAVVSAGTIGVQSWHMIACTYNGSTVTGYVDGTSIGTAALAGPVNINKSISWAGTAGSSSNVLQGAVAEAAIFPTALSGARITAHYAAADQVSQAPVFNGAGGLTGGGPGSPAYNSVLQQILASVRRVY